MTNPADKFKSNLQAREAANQKNLEGLREEAKRKEEQQNILVSNYLNEVPNLINELKNWAEQGGLQTKEIRAGYSEYNQAYTTSGLIVSDGIQQITFYPSGVSKTILFKGIVDIQLPQPPSFRQIYLALDFIESNKQPRWFYINYVQNKGIELKLLLNEEVFFELMEAVFLTK